jgi:hypothetical protein
MGGAMSDWRALVCLGAVCGFGVGLTVGAIVMYVVLRKTKMLPDSNIANTPDMQRLLRCMSGCEQKGLAFGTPAFDECVQHCLSDKKSG